MSRYTKQIRDALRQLKGTEASLRTTLQLVEAELGDLRDQLARAGGSAAADDQADDDQQEA